MFKNTYFEEHLRMTASGYRSSLPEVFCERAALKNFAKVTENDLRLVPFCNKSTGCRPTTS